MSEFSTGISADGSGIARQFDERLSEAAAIIGQYIVEGDVNRPIIEQSADALALNIVKRKLAAVGRAFKPNDPVSNNLQERARPKAQSFLKARCTDYDTAVNAKLARSNRTGNEFVRLDPVYLDFDGLGQSGKCPPWAPQQYNKATQTSTLIPAIYFAFLDPTKDAMFKPGKCEAIAVYVDPNKVEERRTSEWRDGDQRYPVEQVSEWAIEQYEGIVRSFGSVKSVIQAHEDLKRAIADVYYKPTPTDLADDDDGMPPVDIYEGDDIDFDDITGL